MVAVKRVAWSAMPWAWSRSAGLVESGEAAAGDLLGVLALDPDGQVRARFDVPHTGSELRGLTRHLVRLGVGQVAIKRPDGPVVQALLAAGLGSS